jgi:hypothetical protein
MNPRRHFLKRLFQSTASLAMLSVIKPLSASITQDHFPAFMDFSHIITAETALNPAFGKICWRYVQQNTQPPHVQAMYVFYKTLPYVKKC